MANSKSQASRFTFGSTWLIRCLALGSFLAGGTFFIAGCSHIIQRGQSPDTEAMEFGDDFEKPVYIGDVSGPTGLDKLKVDGIALVTQLAGTGSEPPASGQRDYLVAEIKTHNIDDINGLLASKNNAMALIMGQIPAGAKKGDRFDVRVQCMKRSKTTSLEGGFLMQARMKPFVQTRQSMSFGHNSALASGRVIVNSLFESQDDQANKVSGFIPGGGVVTRDRMNTLQILKAYKSIKNATSISRAINDRFSTRIQGSPEGVANPVNDQVIEILIPEDYRHNVGRYFHVVLNIVFSETADQRVNRLERLERQLHDPEKSSIAAIRLEAIGEESKNVLKRGLRSSDFRVQFHSAQALAYLSDSSGADILQKAADIEPAFRWHALTALASNQDSASEEAMANLFNSDSSEARYGAFRALRDGFPDSPLVDGEFVGKEFMLHTVPSSSRPMIHLSRAKVAELVIFGGEQHFNPRLLYFESGLTVKSLGASQVLVKRYLRGGEETKVICSTLVSDVIRQMVKLGANYGDVTRMLKDARRTEAMESQLVINAVPQLGKSYRVIGTSGVSTGEIMDSDSGKLLDQSDDADSTSSSKKDSSRGRKGIFGNFW